MRKRWSVEEAQDWHRRQPWLVGSNYIPASAINQLEMWQAETFDPPTIDRELEWAAAIGMNAMRVFLHDLPWEQDAEGFSGRIEHYLAVADRHGIATLFVIFDDCWHGAARLGPQPKPAGRHNSGWLQSPGHDAVSDESHYPRLEAFVTGVVRRFRDDPRIVGWDVYNEPTNMLLQLQHLPPEERAIATAEALRRRDETKPHHLRLLRLAFGWARSAEPSQPLTAGLFTGDRELNLACTEESDVVSFHCYESPDRLEALMTSLRKHGRPLLCTEYLARSRGSEFATYLPIFKREKIAAFNWGLVNGKTETHLPWIPEPGNPTWFHDVFRGDGTPYDAAEAQLIRRLTDET